MTDIVFSVGPEATTVTSGYRNTPKAVVGDRCYFVWDGGLCGYRPIARVTTGRSLFRLELGGLVPCALARGVQRFAGYRYRWWYQSAEKEIQCQSTKNTDTP